MNYYINNIRDKVTNDVCKKYIALFIMLFMLIVIILSSLFSLYYSIPNNYNLYDFDDKKSNKKTLTKLINIKSGESITLKYIKYQNKLLRIINENNNNINVIFSNIFKSQDLNVNSNKLIKLKYDSDLIIKNNDFNSINIKIELYTDLISN
jgi:hypothetical protein